MSDKLEVTSRYLLDRYSNHSTFSGFDLIIISSRDESQKSLFEKQIRHMIDCDQHYLSSNEKILVVSDEQFTREARSDMKLGAGGSTIHIFKWIANQFGNNVFFEKKILLMHSGGYSQRLPHYSILGKLFANLPIDSDNNTGAKLWTLLDLKFAFLAQFASKMRSGVYITASDDIVVYSFKSTEFDALPQFSEDTFVALGHPSSVEIAVNHGVYILPDVVIDKINSLTVSINSCVKVLQKPTLEQIISQNGVLKNDDNSSFAITDSSYYMGAQIIVDKFLNIDVKTLESEVDCYGDFLCPLGSSPITKDLVNAYYSPFADLLSNIPLKVLYLPHSKFYHLGTLTEYMDALTNYSEKQLAIDLCFKSGDRNDSIKGTVLCSIINENSMVDANSVIECCDFSNIAIETDNNLLYNCIIDAPVNEQKVIKFPANYLIYSVPVILNVAKGWCTFCCRLDSKLKSKIYTDKIFPVFETCIESLTATINMAQQSMRSDLYENNIKLSMHEVNDVKDIDAIIKAHQHLKSLRFKSSLNK